MAAASEAFGADVARAWTNVCCRFALIEALPELVDLGRTSGEKRAGDAEFATGLPETLVPGARHGMPTDERLRRK